MRKRKKETVYRDVHIPFTGIPVVFSKKEAGCNPFERSTTPFFDLIFGIPFPYVWVGAALVIFVAITLPFLLLANMIGIDPLIALIIVVCSLCITAIILVAMVVKVIVEDTVNWIRSRRERGIRLGAPTMEHFCSKLGLNYESPSSTINRFQGKKGHKILVGKGGNGTRTRR
ncbi:MAG: hypothetical protein ACMUHB_01690 [Thermoplasmatota archaeon]